MMSFGQAGENVMTMDDLFARVERAIIDSQLLRDKRRILEQEIATARRALRLAVLEMAELRAAIKADRTQRAALEDGAELPAEIERLDRVTAHIGSQREVLQALRKKIAN
jgi:hypothetical protein